MTISLTELRQRLFELADHVVDTGEPLVVVRRGVRLQLVRENASTETVGRLARLTQQQLVIGAPLAPDESPSTWMPDDTLRVAEPAAAWPRSARKRTKSTP
jgi:hypothetical protein